MGDIDHKWQWAIHHPTRHRQVTETIEESNYYPLCHKNGTNKGNRSDKKGANNATICEETNLDNKVWKSGGNKGASVI